MPNNTMSIIELAADVLREENKPLHINDIAQKIVKKYPNIQTPLDKLPSKISSVLANNIKRHKSKSIFSRPKNKRGRPRQGMYRVKRITRKSAKKFSVPEQPKVTSNYTGKAGENAVLSELMFFGFNASTMAIDEGIDIVASKDNNYFHIQVKTSNISATGKYSFSILKKSFEANDAAITFYILVLRTFEYNRYLNEFLVLPSSDIRNFIEKSTINNVEKLSLRIEKNHSGLFILNNGEDITYASNRFDIIS